MHPGLAEEIRSGLPDVRDAQTRIAMALLEAVPQQDWSKADPYIRDHLAAHTLDAGLLPQLLTDPGLFVHADPVTMRAAIEAVPLEQLGAPARTYLRTAPLLTRSQAPAELRAAFLETAFVEDGLAPYAEALHTLGFALPWRTLWSVPLAGRPRRDDGVPAPRAGRRDATRPRRTADGGPGPDGTRRPGRRTGAPAVRTHPAAPRPVAAFVVPEGTPGSRTVPARTATTSEGGGRALLLHDLLRPGYVDADPAQVRLPSEEAQAAAPFGLSRGADYLRVWARADQEVVAALLSDTPFTGADLSPDGVLVVATERGVTARQILAAAPRGHSHRAGPAHRHRRLRRFRRPRRRPLVINQAQAHRHRRPLAQPRGPSGSAARGGHAGVRPRLGGVGRTAAPGGRPGDRAAAPARRGRRRLRCRRPGRPAS